MLDASYYEKADEIIARYTAEERSLIPIIQDVQETYHYLPPELLGYIAQKLGIPATKAYETGKSHGPEAGPSGSTEKAEGDHLPRSGLRRHRLSGRRLRQDLPPSAGAGGGSAPGLRGIWPGDRPHQHPQERLSRLL